MSNTRKARVPMKEQLRLINECRQSVSASKHGVVTDAFLLDIL